MTAHASAWRWYTSLSGARVARELDRLMIERGKPKMVVSDNGSELTSNASRPRSPDARQAATD
jgi:transposase InsO family protein